LIKSQFFFHALGYRFSLANNFISNMPILALLTVMGLCFFYISIFERQFLLLPFKKPTFFSIITPLGILIALSFALIIVRDDFRRYRYFDYQEGIATVYFAKYDDRQILSFSDARFTLSGGRYSVFYPFGKFNIQDTLHHHAQDILRMKIIEGLDYYRLERIMKILAYGPRDEDIYKMLQHVTLGERYLLPEVFRFWVRYVERRYEAPANDITVGGWLVLNGLPVENNEFFVNKISANNRRTVEPIWQGITGPGGRFQFTCYKDSELDDASFGVTFLVSNRLIGKNLGFLKVVNPVPIFGEPADYTLDTLYIETGPADDVSVVNYLSVKTSSAADSFSFILPRLDPGSSVMITGSVLFSGALEEIAIDHRPVFVDSLLLDGMMQRVNRSRFYLEDSSGTVEIQIN
jgi:uncharacterized membrane protein YgdD (TMEM256/DUF423 family)